MDRRKTDGRTNAQISNQEVQDEERERYKW